MTRSRATRRSAFVGFAAVAALASGLAGPWASPGHAQASGPPALELRSDHDSVQGSEPVRFSGRSRVLGQVRIQQHLGGGWRTIGVDTLRGSHRFGISGWLRGPSGTYALRAQVAPNRRRSSPASSQRRHVSRTLTIEKLAGDGGAQPEQPPTLNAQWRGVDASSNWQWMDQADAERDVSEAATLGADTIRIGLRWSWLEPDKAGVHPADRVQDVDHLLQVASSNGLRVVATVLGTPCWDSTLPGAPETCATNEFQNHPPRDPSDFGRFISFVASRWGGELSGLEVWNEPNLGDYFTGTSAEYVELVRQAHDAVEASPHPELPVVGGSVALADTDYLRQLYQNGIGPLTDAISIHPYDFSSSGGNFGNPVLDRRRR